MNLQRKIRGQKAAPDRDVTTAEGLRSSLKDDLISKARLLSRTAEFFDPVGWWEPLKLQMKLSFQELNTLNWKMPNTLQSHAAWCLPLPLQIGKCSLFAWQMMLEREQVELQCMEALRNLTEPTLATCCLQRVD